MESDTNFWDFCPTEILRMIFKNLNHRDLAQCFTVNKRWRNVVDSLVQNEGAWKDVAYSVMRNKGISLRRRSTISWRNLYMNSILWSNVKEARAEHVKCISISNFKYMHVMRDILMFGSKNTLKYIDVNKLEVLREEQLTCIDYQETDCISVKLVKEGSVNSLHMYGKLPPSANHQIEAKVVHTNTCFYSIEGHKCYIIDKAKILWVYYWDTHHWKHEAYARYYGGKDCISSMNVYHGEIYVLLKWGDVLKYNTKRGLFRKVDHLELPQYICGPTPVMFYDFNAVASVNNDSCKVKLFNSLNEDGHISICYSDLTCAIEHGDVLILGFLDGRVEIIIPDDIYSGVSEVILNVKQYAEYEDNSPEIIALEVSEGLGVHYIYVATYTRLHKVRLSYPELTNSTVY